MFISMYINMCVYVYIRAGQLILKLMQCGQILSDQVSIVLKKKIVVILFIFKNCNWSTLGAQTIFLNIKFEECCLDHSVRSHYAVTPSLANRQSKWRLVTCLATFHSNLIMNIWILCVNSFDAKNYMWHDALQLMN